MIGLPALANQSHSLLPPPIDRFSIDFEDELMEMWIKLDQIERMISELYCLQVKCELKLNKISDFLEGPILDYPLEGDRFPD